MSDRLFKVKNCDRCGGDLKSRKQSWFNSQIICSEVCGAEETTLKGKLKASRGSDFEDCGICIEQIRLMD